MCLSASSSSEGLITDLLSSDGRCEGGTSHPLRYSFNHQIETSACRYKPIRLNGFLNCLNCGQRTLPRATNGTQETRSISKAPGLIDFGPRNPHVRGWKRLGPARLFSFPMFGALGLAAALEDGREDGLMCVRLSANFLLLAQGRCCSSSEYPPQRPVQWLRNAE
jgi:hypothetical protein